MYKKKFLIVFEGPDGSGKSTQIELLKKYLVDCGFSATVLKARVKSKPIYKHLCEIETRNSNSEFPKWLKATIIAFIRAEQILARLNENDQYEIIILDKYIYTTALYLKYKGINEKYAVNILDALPTPDIVFLIDLDATECLERIKSRGKILGNNENIEFLTILNNQLETQIRLHDCKRIVVLNGKQNKNEIFHFICDEISRWDLNSFVV